MPRPNQFETKEEMNRWYQNYRRKNRDKLRVYNRKYNSTWRKKNGYDSIKAYDKRYPEKYAARQLVHTALRSGYLKKGKCEVCKTIKSVHAHHDDYSKPLDVRWFCPQHHKDIHRLILAV